MSSVKMSSVKKRYWAFVFYLDSCPDNWRELLQLSGLPCAVSPYHDSDVNPDGSLKKPHYHVILCYSGPTTYKAVLSFASSFGVNTVQYLESVRGYYRYLSHLDNPEKFQYDEKLILTFNGFCISDFVEISKSEVLSILKRLQWLILDHDIREYSYLMDYLLVNDLSLEYDVASSHTFFLDRYISSRRSAGTRSDDVSELKI